MTAYREASRLFLLLLSFVFFGEVAIMLVLPYLGLPNRFAEALADPMILTLILFPALYFLVFKRLVVKNVALEQAEQQLLAAQSELEDKVAARTREITEAKQTLENSLAMLRDRQREVVILGDMSKMFQASRSFEEISHVAEHQLGRLFPDTSGALYVMRASRNLLERMMTWGDPDGFAASFAPDECWAVRCGRPHFFSDNDNALACEHVSKGNDRGHLCLPITAHGETLGALCLQKIGVTETGAIEPPSADRLEFYATVTENLALTIANQRLHETLRHQALRDPLTGLFNRRYLLEILSREIERARSLVQKIGVVMIDIDHFKRFNDQFGHNAGDTLLAALGDLLYKRVRPTDIVARYGGEEFVIVLIDTEDDLAVSRVDIVREEVATLAVQHKGATLGRITISAGIAVFPTDGENAETLIEAADRVLYEAKRSGRNRVEWYRRKKAETVLTNDVQPQGEVPSEVVGI